MGGVLFIDEAYYLYRPDNERDYGQEAIEILLQVMEIDRDDLVVILAGYNDRMEKFFDSNPGFRSRIAHHMDFPDYSNDELLAIAELMLHDMNYKFSDEAREAFIRYIAARVTQPLFSNARSIRNALDRMRLRQANRLVADLDRMLDIRRRDVAAGVGRARQPGVPERQVLDQSPALRCCSVFEARRLAAWRTRYRSLDLSCSGDEDIRHFDGTARAEPVPYRRQGDRRRGLAVRTPDPGRERLRSLHQADVAQIVAPAPRGRICPSTVGRSVR